MRYRVTTTVVHCDAELSCGGRVVQSLVDRIVGAM